MVCQKQRIFFAILDELKGNAKQIDNEGLESVEKLITEAKKNTLLEVQGVQDLQQEDFQTD